MSNQKKPFFPPKPASASQLGQNYNYSQQPQQQQQPDYYSNYNYQTQEQGYGQQAYGKATNGAQTQQQAYATTQQQQQPAIPYKPATSETTGLYIASLNSWMDESFVYSLFSHTGEVVNVKIIREKSNNFPSGYGFVYFTSAAVAKSVYENFNGHPIPGTNKTFKLNFATQSLSSTDTRTPANTVTTVVSPDEECSLFVGDLAPDVHDYFLLSSFQTYYPSAFSARVVIDPYNRTPKGYGFVYFRDRNERDRALVEMNGQYISYRPIKVNIATKKEKIPSMPILPPNDPQNTTIFIGGIDLSVTHDVLRQFFKPYGEVKTIKVPVGKGCAFIEFKDHRTAEICLAKLGGTTLIGNNHVRVSWGRPPAPNPNGSGEEYYEGQEYNYQDPNAYAVPTTGHQYPKKNNTYINPATLNHGNNVNPNQQKKEEDVTLKKRKVDQVVTEKPKDEPSGETDTPESSTTQKTAPPEKKSPSEKKTEAEQKPSTKAPSKKTQGKQKEDDDNTE